MSEDRQIAASIRERDFSIIADTLRVGLEPLGYRVHVRTNEREIVVTNQATRPRERYEVVVRG